MTMNLLLRSAFLSCLGAMLLAPSAPVQADGKLTHMSGPVLVRTADGKSQPAMVGGKVSVGETLVTGAGGYARMEMTDGGEMVLRPDSQLKVESYKFAEAKPAEDSFLFSMLKGGMRTVTGLIGKRGNRDAYQLNTPTATIGIRGTQFDMRVCQGDCGVLGDGTYLAVRYGAVHTANKLGGLDVAAGQVAHVPPQQPPIILPRDPGVGFTPPPVIPKPDERKRPPAAGASPPEGGAGSPNRPAAAGQAPTSPDDDGQSCIVE